MLVNCFVLSEGTDLPRTDCVVMTRPTCNSNLYAQMVGRGLRLHSGKQFCFVLDFIDRSHSTSRSLVTFPSLFQFQNGSVGTGLGIVRGPNEEEEFQEIDYQELDVHCVDMEDYPGFGLAWIYICDRVFAIVSAYMTILLKISPEDATLGHLEIFHSVPKVLRLDAEGRSFEAEGQCEDELISELIPKLLEFLRITTCLDSMQADRPWRKKRPATNKQKWRLTRILEEIDEDADRRATAGQSSLFLKSVSCGRASDLISKYVILKKLGMERPTVASLLYG